jgi:hypothetical protein
VNIHGVHWNSFNFGTFWILANGKDIKAQNSKTILMNMLKHDAGHA